ncbi:MAG: type II toxin-antitoxin system HicB family antitoxin [Methylobacter sp.]|nr:MAG: type II toxin-antitoxin system HicB family antitoxin [Methylobacter sp.]
MRAVKFTSWQDDTFFIGFLNEYPDCLTQGITKEELIENLKDLLIDIESGQAPYIRKGIDYIVPY